MTYKQAKMQLIYELVKLGWAASPELKIPHATSPDGLIRLWFKPQAVYISARSTRGSHDMGGARSLWFETKNAKVADLIASAEHAAQSWTF